MQFCIDYFRWYLFLLIYLLSSQNSFCQDWKFIPNKDNLFHNHPTGFLEDSLGFMWMGTNRGLTCFDGSHFFSPFPTSNFPNTGVISSLATNQQGQIRFRSNTEQFVLKKSTGTETYHLEKDTIPFFKIDKLGRQWKLLQPENDLYLRNQADDWTYIGVDSLWLSLDIDKKGNVWLVESKGGKNTIYRIGKDTTQYQVIPSAHQKFPPLRRYFTFINTPDDHIYYYNGATDELFKLNQQAALFEKVVPANDAIRRPLDIIQKKLNQHLQQENVPLKITAHYFDSKGNFWVGTEYGIFIFSTEKRFSFDRILEKSSVRCVTKSMDGDLWIGSYDGLYNVKSGQNPSLVSPEFFYSFYREDSTSIWGCTEGGSLRKMDKTTQKIAAVFPLTNDKFMRVLHRDEKGVEWLGGYGFLEKGSYANDGKPLAYDRIADESLENIYALATSKKDGLWVGCMNGLFLVNQREEVLKNKHLPSFYSSETILCLEPSIDRNTLWVGSKFAGLFLINNESGKVLKHYGTHNSLPDNTIASIVNVEDSLLFLGTNKGLCKLDIAAEVVTTYMERNSSFSNEYNHGASFRDEAGNLYFGTINGMVYFHPDSLQESPFEQKLYFTTFEKIIPESNEMGLASSIWDTKKRLEVFPSENIFTISFSSDNLFANRKSNIYYQMENLNANWVKTTSNQVTYNNLEPGDYTFKVKLESLDAKDQVIGVPVKVYPQFYQTLWFKGSIILGVFGIISFIYRFRIQQLKKEQHIRENISRNIHDDLGGSLTYLHIQAKKLYKSEAASTKNIAHKLLQHSKLSLESLTNLLWVLDASNDTLEETVEFLRRYIQNFFSQEAVDCILDIQVNQPLKKLKPEKKQHLFLILKEACTNILKHTHPSTIHFYCFDRNNQLNFGLTNEYAKKKVNRSSGNGLKNITTRVQDLKGLLQIADEAKKFSIDVKIPL